MRRYRLVIFDFDGTLADSGPWFVRTLNDIAECHGFRQVSEAEIAMLRGQPTREIIRYLGVRFWRLPAIARDMRARSAAAASGIALFAGVPELLQAIKAAGLQVAIVSSNGEETVRRVLGASAALVDHLECGASLFGKASRFAALRRRLRLAPGQVLVVGDESRDIEAARKTGCDSVAVTWGYASEAALVLAGPTFLARSAHELATRLDLGS